MSSLYDFVKKSLEQKKLYHSKLLTDDAIYTNMMNAVNTEPIFSEYANLNVIPFNMTALSISLLFDFNPNEVEPLALDFQLSLPSLEEFAEGINIKIEPISIEVIPPWLMLLDLFIDQNFKELFKLGIKETKLEKGVYNKSKFGSSYYDPPAVSKFISGTLSKVFVEKLTLSNVKGYIDGMVKSLNINEHVARTLFNRVSMILSAQVDTFILGYGVLGRSKLGERTTSSARLRFINHDLEVRETAVNNLTDVLYSFVLGATALGYGLLGSKEPLFKEETYTSPTGYSTPGASVVVRFIGEKVGRIRGRYSATALAFANYSKPEERQSYLQSERADQYMSLQLMRYLIENMVDPVIRKYESSPNIIRMYKSAVLQLLSYPAKRHRWGYDTFKLMDDEEFRTWWVENWSKQGLNPSVLNELYGVVSKWLKEWRRIKLDLGSYLRRKRLSLALAK